MKGHVIVFVAPSGTGKSTILRKIKSEFLGLLESISYTTRPPRKQEKHGVHYFFVSEEEFIERRDNDEFLEWAEVHSHYYGTPKRWVEKKLASGKILLFDLDVQGADSLKEYFGDRAHVLFISPPSLSELEKRLRQRGTDDLAIIKLRLENAKKELKRKKEFDYLVYNDDFDCAYEELKCILKKIQRCSIA